MIDASKKHRKHTIGLHISSAKIVLQQLHKDRETAYALALRASELTTEADK